MYARNTPVWPIKQCWYLFVCESRGCNTDRNPRCSSIISAISVTWRPQQLPQEKKLHRDRITTTFRLYTQRYIVLYHDMFLCSSCSKVNKIKLQIHKKQPVVLKLHLQKDVLESGDVCAIVWASYSLEGRLISQRATRREQSAPRIQRDSSFQRTLSGGGVYPGAARCHPHLHRDLRHIHIHITVSDQSHDNKVKNRFTKQVYTQNKHFTLSIKILFYL